ncbi:MAG: hypothetical protein QOD76_563 [Solirubrobacteraceae bacterium]|nr:hypothetical protein [Solirubrobacteraceae bacterium]
MTARVVWGAVTACVAIGAALPASAAAIPTPDVDPFYQAPTGLANQPPGTVLRSREVTVTGLGVPIPVKSWQLLYRSNDTKGHAIAAVATVLVPLAPYAAGERPLVSYQMAIDSLGPQCTPSYEMRNGNEKEMSAVGPLIEAGLAVVVPDFESQNMAYGAGVLAARTTLDGIRAAERFAPAGFPGTKTPVGLWGYSGGGQGTAWAAEQQPGYAPELNVKGVAEGGVPPDLEQVARQIDGGPFFGVYFAASVGLSREYPEVNLDALLNDKGKALKEKIGKECAETLVTGYPYQRMSDYTTVGDPLVVPRVRAVINAVKLPKATPTAPVYIYHSVVDELIPIAGPDALVGDYCLDGARILYQRDVAGEHVAYAFTGAPAALAYLLERFQGQPAPTNCGPARRRRGSPSSHHVGGARACSAGQAITLRPRRRRGERIRRIVATVAGRQVASRRGRDLRTIRITGLSPGQRTIRLRIRGSRGRRTLTLRRIVACR